MKRMLSLALAVLMLALALAGCGGTQTASSSQAASSEAAEAAETTQAGSETEAEVVPAATKTPEERMSEAEAAAAQMVYQNEDGQMVVVHKYGETVVPENPQRIVSIKLEDLALALGVEMVACRNFDGFYLEDDIAALGIDSIAVDEEANTVNFEQVLAYKPDLIIIRDAFDQSIYDELSKIAPTIAFRLQSAEASMLALGMALDMEDQARARLEEYYEKLSAAEQALQVVAGEKVAMLRVLQKEIRLYPYSTNDMSSFLYSSLGLTPEPMAVEYDNASSLAISLETLPDLTAEHIFLVAGYGSQTDEADIAAKQYYEKIKADPLWQAVPAVQTGNIYEVDSRTWLTHGIIAVERRVDDVLACLT